MTEPTDIRLLDNEELLHLPEPRWLIQDILPEGDYSVLWGPSRQGKSFLALDWAVSLALGRPWQGKYPVMQTPVVYIAAEGGRGIQKRVRALMKQHSVTEIPGIYYLVEPLYVREPGTVEAFLEKLEEDDIWPGLVIIDTLSRSFGGGEENASEDMGYFVDAVSRLANGRFMTVLVVHHSNATGGRERGSTILRCGANAMFECKGDINKKTNRLDGVFLKNDKQKDSGEAEEIYLRTSPVEDSLVLEISETPENAKKKAGSGEPIPMRKVDMLRLLGCQENGLTYTEWRLAANVEKRTFSRRIKRLMDDGDIYKDASGRYYVTPATTDLAALADED